MDLRDYLQRIQADLGEAIKLLPAQSNAISTVADLTAALKAGGTYRIADGTYLGNFFASKPVTIAGLRGAVLQPLDKLLPTVSVQASDVTLQGFTVKNGAPDRECVVVGDVNATDATKQPNNVTLDGLAVEAGAAGGHRGIALHGSNLTVKNSRVTGFWEVGRDAQAIWILNGPGPYTVIDNYLEGSGEVIMVGGSTFKIPNVVPSDIVIARNTCYKPDTWRTNGATVKNSIELKAGKRVLIEGNLCDGNWRNGQDGNPIVLTVRNQSNDSPWVLMDEVTVRGNITQRCPDGFALAILGLDDNYPSQQSQRITVEHNLFKDSPNGFKIGNAVATALIIRNNTLPAVTSSLLQFYDTRTPAVKSPFTFTDNVARGGEYGITATNLGVGLPALNGHTTVVAFTGNIIEKTAARGIPWPAGNTLVEPGQLATLIDPASFKLKTGTAGY